LGKQKKAFNPKSLRNLPQYRDMSEEEFTDAIENKEFSEDFSEEFKRRTEEKKEELSRDYDLSDMKSNDLLMLEALAQSMVALDDFEAEAYAKRKNISYDNISIIDKMQKIVSDLRSDISRQQTDLKMSRKIRKGDDREDVIQKVATLTEKANQFYKEKMAYVICPNCDMLLATIWVQYPEVDNELNFTCNRRKGGREPEVLCNHKFTVTSTELWANKQVSNKSEVLPESIT
jgi:hypothetical protein